MKSNAGILVLLILLFSVSSPLFSEKKSFEESSKPLKQQRIDIIRYGIDSEIIDLLKTLKKNKNKEFNEELLKLLQTTHNANLESKVIDLFLSEKDPRAVQYAFSELKNNYDLSNEIQTQFISYISDYQTPEISSYLATLIHHDNTTISNAAIDALGKSKNDTYGSVLLKMLDDPTTSDTQKIHIIEALGNLKYKEAVPSISKYLKKDYTTNRSLKWKACIALGEMGDEKSLPTIVKLFSDNDPYLRNFAVQALRYFPAKKTEDMIIQGLRDSSWRVRVSAANSLGKMKSKKAVPILIYKAQNDPDVRNVRNAAIKALGKIQTKKALSFLQSFVLDSKAVYLNRNTAISVLAKDDLSGSLSTFKKLMDEEWNKTKSPLLDYTCKVLSTQKNPKLVKLYAKMLEYTKTMNLKIYGLRGIKLNKFISLKGKVEELTTDKNPQQIRKIAKDTLEALK